MIGILIDRSHNIVIATVDDWGLIENIMGYRSSGVPGTFIVDGKEYTGTAAGMSREMILEIFRKHKNRTHIATEYRTRSGVYMHNSVEFNRRFQLEDFS